MRRELFIKDTQSADSFRAHLGLAFLYEIESKYDKEWEQYSAVIKQTDKPEFYLLPEIDGLAFNKSITNENSGILELLNKEASNKEDGFISAVANENLGQYYDCIISLIKLKNITSRWALLTTGALSALLKMFLPPVITKLTRLKNDLNPTLFTPAKTISRFIGLI